MGLCPERDQVVTALAIGAVATATGVALTPVAVPVLLGVVGFGVAGPIAGSIAAGLQASIGNVAAGSLFSLAQSMAMGGGVPALLSAIGGLGAGAAAGAVAGVL